MSFTEQTFLFIFLPIVIGLYLIASIFKNIKIRNIVIILCNLVFVYLAGLDNFLFYLLITITTHILGNLLYLSKQNDGKVTKWMIAAIAIVLTPLIVSKYLYTFIINSETLSTTFIFQPEGTFTIFVAPKRESSFPSLPTSLVFTPENAEKIKLLHLP